jgi:glutamate 5-kinase
LVNAQGDLREAWLDSLAQDIAELPYETIIVSSGAIALGRKRLGLNGPLTLGQKQACAAAGQSRLTQGYERALGPHNLGDKARVTAQALLTVYDTEDRRRYLNARSTLETLLGLGAIPIINENDTVATDEIRYGDNDRLAARTAQMVGADALILLSDIDGLYTANPRTDSSAQHLREVRALTPDILAMAGTTGSQVGTGGMVTKLMAAQIAMAAGCDMCIHDGQGDHPLRRLSTDRCTWFLAGDAPASARRQWIAGSLKPCGRAIIDSGAAQALSQDKSLLLAGVTRIEGAFQKGDAIDILCEDSPDVIARGLSAYSSTDAAQIAGLRSDQIESVLGYSNGAALIHRDNLVRLSRAGV